MRLAHSVPVFVLLTLILACQINAQTKTPMEMASLRPIPGLTWQRVHPAGSSDAALQGPILYQLLLNASGTPGTIPMFDTNPRHLTNSPITVGVSNVAISGLSIDRSSGLVTFAGGQTFPGTITNIATGTGLTGGPITSTGTVSIANGGVGTTQIASKAVTASLVGSGAATSGQILTADGSGGAAWQPVPAATVTDSVWLSAGSCVGATPTPAWDSFGGGPTFTCYSSSSINKGVAQMLANQNGIPVTSWKLPQNWDGGTITGRAKVLMPTGTGAISLLFGSGCSPDGTAGTPSGLVGFTPPSTAINDNFIHTISATIRTVGCSPGDLMYIGLDRQDNAGAPAIDFFGLEIQYSKK